MSNADLTANETGAQAEYKKKVLGGDADDVRAHTEQFPVTIPENIEEMARERYQAAREEGTNASLKDYLLDYIDLDYRLLVSDVADDLDGEPATHAIHSSVSRGQYRQLLEEIDDGGEEIGTFVREAVLNELERRHTPDVGESDTEGQGAPREIEIKIDVPEDVRREAERQRAAYLDETPGEESAGLEGDYVLDMFNWDWDAPEE